MMTITMLQKFLIKVLKECDVLNSSAQSDKGTEGQLDGALDEKVEEKVAASLSDLELKPSSGSSDLLISGALKDENNKPDDLGELFVDGNNIDADLMILATQKYTPPEEIPEKQDRSV